MKIGEINAIGKCDEIPTWNMKLMYDSGGGYKRRRTWRLNDEFYKIAFTQGQRNFLEKHDWRVRPKPQYNPIVEIYIDKSTLEPSDYTIMALLFV